MHVALKISRTITALTKAFQIVIWFIF